MKINTYAVNCNDAWLNTEGDDISGSYVKYKDHQDVVAELEAKCAALAAENGRYSMSAGQADQRMSESRAVRSALGFQEDADDVSPSDLVEKIQSLITEQEILRSAHPQPLGPIMDLAIDAFNSAEMPETGMLNAFFILRGSIIVKTPATESFLAEVRAQGVEIAISQAFREGIPVNRMQFISRMMDFAAQLRHGDEK